jgi:hypothetical protein
VIPEPDGGVPTGIWVGITDAGSAVALPGIEKPMSASRKTSVTRLNIGVLRLMACISSMSIPPQLDQGIRTDTNGKRDGKTSDPNQPASLSGIIKGNSVGQVIGM